MHFSLKQRQGKENLNQKEACFTRLTDLAHCAVPPCLDVMLALIASVHKAVLSLVVQFNEHTHRAPLAPPERAELPMFVPGQSQESITAIHQITGEQGVRVDNGRQSVDHGAGVEVYYKEYLQQSKKQFSC